MLTPLRLHLHGPPRAERADGGSVALAAREAALLARLWLDGPCSRAAMAGFLWPQTDERRARANLRQTLLRLKRDVGPVLAEADGLLALAAGVAPEPGADATGPLLGPLEFDDAPELAEWLAERRARTQRDRLREGLQAAQQALQAGRTGEALAAADAVLAADAAVEEAHRIRMQVFLARGDRAAAIGAWDDCRDALRRAFGIQPGAATHALGRAAMAGEGLAVADAAPGAGPGAGRDHPPEPAPFVGRSAALARVHEALAEGHAVLVVGAGGLGKSSLLREGLADGPASRTVGARPGDEQLPGVMVARLLAVLLAQPGAAAWADERLRRELAGFLPETEGTAIAASASALDHRRRIAAFVTLLRRQRAAGLRQLVVDDLQWADALSLEALAAAVGDWLAEPAALPLPLLACRSGVERPAVLRLLDTLQASGRCVRVELAPLTPADLARWLQQRPPVAPDHVPALAEALHARVGGNPAFVHDALRALHRRGGTPWRPGEPLPLPANLVDSVRARLAELPASSLQLAQLAAVAGTDFSLGLAAAVVGCAPLALAGDFARLEEAEVLTAGGFVHDLVAEAVAASLPASLRGPLHALVAEHLQARGGALARLAHHRRAAGDRAAAADAFQQAAQDARRRWRMVDAAEDFEAEAVLCDGAGGRPRRLRAWRDAAHCWLNQGDIARAKKALQAASAEAQDELDRLRVREVACTLYLNSGDYAALAVEATALAQALLPFEAALDDAELTSTLLGVASAAPYVEEPAALLKAIDSLQNRGTGVPRLAARIELAAGMVLNWLGWPARARERLLRSEALAREHGLDGERVNLGNQLARCDEGQGDLPAAVRRCQQTERLARELGVGVGFEADLVNLRGLYEARQGRGEAARAAFDEARRRLGPRGRPTDYMQLREARALAWLGDTDAAARAVQALSDSLGSAARGPFVAYLCWTRAVLAHQAGDDAGPWLDRAAASCAVPDSLLGLRQRLMRLRCGAPAGATDDPVHLARALAERGLHGLLAVRASPGAATTGPVAAGAQDPWCP
jgi:DNA-binding SARP family transcriptional activator